MTTQDQIQGIQVADVVGWSKSQDGKMAVIGLKTPSGQQLFLGLEADVLWKTTVSVIDANSAFPVDTGIGTQTGMKSLDIASIDIGQNVETGEVVLAVKRPNGATLPLRFSREGAAWLRDTLAKALAG